MKLLDVLEEVRWTSLSNDLQKSLARHELTLYCSVGHTDEISTPCTRLISRTRNHHRRSCRISLCRELRDEGVSDGG